jgi:hypothetical protein
MSKPNFTGVWKLIRGECNFGFLPPPHLRVDTIAHEDNKLSIRTRQKDDNGDITVDRDLVIGEEPIKISIQGKPRKVRAFWDELTLVVETKSEISGKERRLEDRWSMDEDTEWVTIDRFHDLPGGPVRQSLRLQRRAA